jgi:hypothetical protein
MVMYHHLRLTHHNHIIIYEFEFEFWCLAPLSAIFHYIMATSFSGGGSQSTQREPLTQDGDVSTNNDMIVTC